MNRWLACAGAVALSKSSDSALRKKCLLIFLFTILLCINVFGSNIIEVDDKHYIYIEGNAKTVIGDEKGNFFKPNLTLSKWDEEVSLTVKFLTAQKITPTLTGNKVSWKTANIEIEFYPKKEMIKQVTHILADNTFETIEKEHNAFEFEIILNSKPLTNKIFFEIETENLAFYYQPPLNSDDGTVERNGKNKFMAYRPEQIVGSYAVYHANKENVYNSLADADKYKVGKTFHIYRPFAVDAIDNNVWCDLIIENGVMMVSVPQEFLDSAIYPIRIDPTFGYESAGDSSGIIGGIILGSSFKIPEDGLTSKITGYIAWKGSGTNIGCGIYNDDNSLVEGSSFVSDTNTTFDWREFSLGGELLTQDLNYFLVCYGETGPPAGSDFLRYDEGSGDRGVDDVNAYDGSWPNPAELKRDPSNSIFSVYVTYTLANTAPDLNIWQVDSHDINIGLPYLTYPRDKNLTIKFWANDVDDDDLNFNAWYGTIQGSQVNDIVFDVNLSTNVETGACDSNGLPKVCNWDFNTMNITDDQNYWLTIEVNDGEDSNTMPTTLSFLVDNTPFFTDINLFEYQDYDMNIDLNAATDSNVVYDFNIIGVDLNFESIQVFSHIQHDGEDENHFGYVRDEQRIGWEDANIGTIQWEVLDSIDRNYHLRSTTVEDNVYKHWALNLEHDELYGDDGDFTLNNSKDWLKVLHTASSEAVDSNLLIEYHFSATYNGTQSKTLTLFDCNFEVADPENDLNCNSYPFTSTTQKDPTGLYHIDMISNDANQVTGDHNVLLNADGNHWLYFNCSGCNGAKYWTIDYVDINSNADRVRNWSSTTGLDDLAAYDKTPITHMHWLGFEQVHHFDFIIQIDTNSGEDFNSPMQRFVINYANLQPEINFIETPKYPNYYKNTIDVNVFVEDPNLDTLVCDINLLDSTEAHVAVIATGLATVVDENGLTKCVSSLDTTSVPDGNYLLRVLVRETGTSPILQFDLNEDQSWGIDNRNPTFIISPNNYTTSLTVGEIKTEVFVLKNTSSVNETGDLNVYSDCDSSIVNFSDNNFGSIPAQQTRNFYIEFSGSGTQTYEDCTVTINSTLATSRIALDIADSVDTGLTISEIGEELRVQAFSIAGFMAEPVLPSLPIKRGIVVSLITLIIGAVLVSARNERIGSIIGLVGFIGIVVALVL